MQRCDICDTEFKGPKCPNCGSTGYNDQICIRRLELRGYVFNDQLIIVKRPESKL